MVKAPGMLYLINCRFVINYSGARPRHSLLFIQPPILRLLLQEANYSIQLDIVSTLIMILAMEPSKHSLIYLREEYFLVDKQRWRVGGE